ncbi:MAG: ATP-binding protein [Candidatus Nanopelagicales bacterium]
MWVAASDARWMCLPPAIDSPARSREFLRQSLTAWGLSDLVDDALLLVSELASNALLHARSSMVVTASWSPGAGVLRVTVRDDQQEGEPTVRHADSQATSGRGLEIVATVSSRWGILRDHDGKAVWFELARR